MSINELRDFIFENYYKRIEFVKEKSYNSMKRLKKRFVVANKLIEKIPDPGNAKELSIIYKKVKHKTSKTIRNNYLSTENI